jgi:hypothetical protein
MVRPKRSRNNEHVALECAQGLSDRVFSVTSSLKLIELTSTMPRIPTISSDFRSFDDSIQTLAYCPVGFDPEGGRVDREQRVLLCADLIKPTLLALDLLERGRAEIEILRVR